MAPRVILTADAHALTPGHRILFPDSTTISEDDQRAIFDLLGGSPAGAWTTLDTSNAGFPDGATYQHDHNRATEPGGCDGVG